MKAEPIDRLRMVPPLKLLRLNTKGSQLIAAVCMKFILSSVNLLMRKSQSIRPNIRMLKYTWHGESDIYVSFEVKSTAVKRILCHQPQFIMGYDTANSKTNKTSRDR